MATASDQPVMTTSLAAATAGRGVAEAYSEATVWSANSRPKHHAATRPVPTKPPVAAIWVSPLR